MVCIAVFPEVTQQRDPVIQKSYLGLVGPQGKRSSMNRTFTAVTVAITIYASLGAATSARADDATADAGLFDRDTLTGDWGGARTRLADDGVTLGLRYIGEVWGTVDGGVHRGTATDHQFLATADFDFDKAAGLEGLTGHVSALSLLGHGPTYSQVKNALDVSNTEIYGIDETKNRLWTLWLQKTAFDGELSVRLGQLAVDDEFLVSPTAGNLINATFGADALVFANLPAGQPANPDFLANGPVYPLSAPGVRILVQPSEAIAWQTAVTTYEPESIDRGGAQFKFDGNAFVISELQYLVNQAKNAPGLPAMYKIGGWYDTSRFNTLDLLRPGPTQGQGALYAVLDQTVLKSGARALSVFLRAGYAPDDTVSTVTRYVDGGVGMKGLIPGRADDIATVGMAYAGVGDGVKSLDRAAGTRPHDYETVVEVNYTVALAPWWTFQPDFQYIVHPGYGQMLDTYIPTAAPTDRIPNATVFGARTTITF